MGGILARPAVQYPDMSWGIFETFPYLLPCAVALVLQGLAVVLVMTLMVEPVGVSRIGSPRLKSSSVSTKFEDPLLGDSEAPHSEMQPLGEVVLCLEEELGQSWRRICIDKANQCNKGIPIRGSKAKHCNKGIPIRGSWYLLPVQVQAHFQVRLDMSGWQTRTVDGTSWRQTVLVQQNSPPQPSGNRSTQRGLTVGRVFFVSDQRAHLG